MSIFNINTNTTALNALTNLGNTGNALSQSIQRLSTGLKINSAADDPSGLIAANTFKTQLGGISQAISNSQDALNYAKTADGAMGQITSLLTSAYSLAVAASNSGTLSSSQVQADNSQLQSIMNSVTTIANNTQFGTKHLLDGSAGTTSAVTDSSLVAAVNIGGTFNGAALSANSAVTITVSTAATQASTTLSKTFATAGTTVGADQFTLNGQTFSTTSTSTVQNVLDQINGASGQTGVAASFTAGAGITLTSTAYGTNAKINFADSAGGLNAGASTAAGTDAVATVTVGGSAVTFTGGQNGNDGLTLTDGDGNSIVLTQSGNNATTTNKNVGQVTVGSSQFQIGANYGQTASLSLGNFQAGSLGSGAVAGLNLSNLSLSTAADAGNAMKVIQAAISQVSTAQGKVGSFESNVINPNIAQLGTAQQNLSATLSNIQDTNVAQEMTNFTRLQILQQAGVSVLAQANSMPQSVLKLLG